MACGMYLAVVYTIGALTATYREREGLQSGHFWLARSFVARTAPSREYHERTSPRSNNLHSAMKD